MMAQRKTMPKLQMPCYDLEDVPAATRDLKDSVVVRVNKREDWMSSLSEMLLLCNEAAARRVAKFGIVKKNTDGTQTKPLGLEYMADRLDTDDPLEGFQIRSSEGWLQGFITMTTFTVWQRAFRWDSHAPESGIPDEDLADRKWDSDNSLSRALEAQNRSGDPDNEGIIWPKVAEISLLGALGCGSWLMRLVLEELEQTGEYEFVVVQATDNSVPFYENFGFIRVGAVAKYREKTPEQLAAIAAQMAAKKGGGAGGGLAGPGGAAADKLKSKKRLGNDRDDDEVDLPDWLKGKRFKFFVGGGSGSAGKEFGKQPAVAGGGGALKVVIKMGTSAQKQQRDVRIDWEDHSDENVARRRAAGFVPYCHWTFPEQSVEDICPSYMMGRRLVRKDAGRDGAMHALRGKLRDQLPVKKRTCPEPDAEPVHTGYTYDEVTKDSIAKSMYNKVVRVINNKHKFDYYYVLHYILDMDWCHLVPMHAKTTFGGESFRAGRPRYKLVPEGEGRELDVPAARCRQVSAYAVSKTNNADKEVWDIVLPEEQDEYERKLAEEKRRCKQRGIEHVSTPAGCYGADSLGNQRPRSRRQEPWEEAAMRVLRKLIRRKNAWPFLDPVDPVALQLPDYFDVIKHPMDLMTVKSKLTGGQYASIAAWRDEVLLVFDNAMLYNPPGNAVHEMAAELKAVAVEDIAKEQVKYADDSSAGSPAAFGMGIGTGAWGGGVAGQGAEEDANGSML